MDSNDSAAIIPVLNEANTNTTKIKQPKRILYFSDGILEEYSDDEEKEDEKDSSPVVDPNTLNWFPYLWYYALFYGGKTINACDYIGEYLAYFFGITSPKYQYEIDEYNWMKKQEEEEKRQQNEEEFWKQSDDSEQMINMQPTIKPDEWESVIEKDRPIRENYLSRSG